MGKFTDGDPDLLGDEAIARIYAINERVDTGLPEIVTTPTRTSLLYDEEDAYNPDTVRLVIDSQDGHVVSGGYGYEWWETDNDHPRIRALIDEFGEANVEAQRAASPS